jgi:hypothetical protein
MTTTVPVIRRLALVAGLAATLAGAAGCGSNADTVSHNLSVEAEKFRVQRQILVVNNITDKVLFEVEGKCSIERSGRELIAICKHNDHDFRKHFLGLADNVSYIVAQVGGVDVSEYRTKIVFRPQSIVPDLDLVTGEQDSGGATTPKTPKTP